MSESTLLILISLGYAALALITLRFLLARMRMRSNRQLLRSIDLVHRSGRPDVITASVAPSRSPLVQRIIDSNYGSWLRKTLGRAGIWQEEEYQKWVSQKVSLLIAGLIATLFLIQITELSRPILLSLPVVAFFVLDAVVIDRAKARVVAIERVLPETIDLLGMCVTAGIGFHAGMQRIANSSENPLSQEFSRVLGEMKVGRSRTDALMDMAERLDVPALTEFVNSVLQVDRLGVPMAKILEEQSRRMRVIRHEKAREQAQKLPVKILAPIMLFMMPALLIIVLGPAVVSILQSFG
jgi:tight adherence protein C